MNRSVILFVVLVSIFSFGQEPHQPGPYTGKTMRPVVRGRHAAISSMRQAAAFDAAVAGQAVLGLTDPADNGLGSDAELLVYVARENKVYSINAEPKAPKLATINWYNQNNGGKIPTSDGLLSGGIPGVVDAWYILLDRWGP